MAEGKNEMNQPQDNRPGAAPSRPSGSDTVSAARMAAGSSAGAGGAGSGPSGGQARMGSGAGPGASKEQPNAAEKARRAAEEMQGKASEAYDEATDWAKEKYERASSWAADAYEQGAGRAKSVGARSGRQFARARGGVQGYVAQNPIVVGLVGLAAGLLLGALLPRTRREDEAFGEWADEARHQGLRYAQDVTRRGREVVEEALSGEDPRFGRHASEFNRGPSADPH